MEESDLPKEAEDTGFRKIPNFNDRYEINVKGEIRSVKSQKTTQPHHISKKAGPIFSLNDGVENVRISSCKIVHELFGLCQTGWDEIDPLPLPQGGRVFKTIKSTEDKEKDRLAKEEKAAERTAKAKARVEAMEQRHQESLRKSKEKEAAKQLKAANKAVAEAVPAEEDAQLQEVM